MTTMARTHAEAREDFENVQEKKNVRDRYSPNRIHTLIVISKDKEKKYVKPKAVKMIALGFFALALVLSTARPVQAQDAKGPYPNMAPLDQYLMADRNAEIAMARSAAPEAISGDAEVLVLGAHGYETAVKGKNGFVCLVERAWMGPFDGPKFWNPKVRGPVCYNPPAVHSILPLTYKRTEMVLAGQSKAQILDGMQTYVKQGLPPLEPGGMAYMMSKEQYLTDSDHHNWISHLMFYTPLMSAAAWGADLPHSPVMLNPQFRGAPEPIDDFMVPAGWWSDGTPDPVKD